jgi:hypothetical protein
MVILVRQRHSSLAELDEAGASRSRRCLRVKQQGQGKFAMDMAIANVGGRLSTK